MNEMSAILHVKGILLSHMSAEPELKDAVMGVLNAIDLDLDNCDYDNDIMTDATEDAIKNLDKVLVGGDEEVEDDSNAIIERQSPLDIAEQEDEIGSTST